MGYENFIKESASKVLKEDANGLIADLKLTKIDDKIYQKQYSKNNMINIYDIFRKYGGQVANRPSEYVSVWKFSDGTEVTYDARDERGTQTVALYLK